MSIVVLEVDTFLSTWFGFVSNSSEILLSTWFDIGFVNVDSSFFDNESD